MELQESATFHHQFSLDCKVIKTPKELSKYRRVKEKVHALPLGWSQAEIKNKIKCDAINTQVPQICTFQHRGVPCIQH